MSGGVMDDAVGEVVSGIGELVDDIGRWFTATTAGAVGEELELDQTDDPRALVLGDPDALTGTARHLAAMGDAFGRTSAGLRGIDLDRWTGSAADAFHAAFQNSPKGWVDAAEAFRRAAGLVEDVRGAVTWAQGRAAEAVALYREGQEASARARRDYDQQVDAYNTAVSAADATSAPQPPPPFVDPGTPAMERAQEMLADARRQRDAAGTAAAGALADATELAPPLPSQWDRFVDDGLDTLDAGMTEAGHVVKGIGEGVEGLVKFVRTLNPTDPYNLTHPAQYLDGVSTTAAGLVHSVVHPAELVKGVIGTGWGSDPAEAFGKLIPNIALGLATGGSGTAAAAGERAVLGVGERSVAGAGERALGTEQAAAAGERAAPGAAVDPADHPVAPAPDIPPPGAGPTGPPAPDHAPVPATPEPDGPPPLDGGTDPLPANAEPDRPPLDDGPTDPPPTPPEPDPAPGGDGPAVVDPAPDAPPPDAARPVDDVGAADVEAAQDLGEPGHRLSDIEPTLDPLHVHDTDAAPVAAAEAAPGRVTPPPVLDDLGAADRQAAGQVAEAGQPMSRIERVLGGFEEKPPGGARGGSEESTLGDPADPAAHPPVSEPGHGRGERVGIPPPLRREQPLPLMKELLPRFRGENDINNPHRAFGSRVVHYFDPVELEEHRLFVKDGLLYSAEDGRPFDTTGGDAHWSGSGFAIFVMDSDGNLYATLDHMPGRIHHSSFLAGGPVAGAGEIAVENGELRIASRQSGHYRPTLEQHEQVRRELERQGLDVAPPVDFQFDIP
jgi:hypothetical protein